MLRREASAASQPAAQAVEEACSRLEILERFIHSITPERLVRAACRHSYSAHCAHPMSQGKVQGITRHPLTTTFTVRTYWQYDRQQAIRSGQIVLGARAQSRKELAMRPLLLALLLACASPSSTAQDCLSKAADYAERVCGAIQRSGAQKVTEENGQLTAQVSGIVRRLFGGVDADLNAKVLKDTYENVLREDLGNELFSLRNCRMKMADAGIAECKRVEKNTNVLRPPGNDENPPSSPPPRPQAKTCELMLVGQPYSCPLPPGVPTGAPCYCNSPSGFRIDATGTAR